MKDIYENILKEQPKDYYYVFDTNILLNWYNIKEEDIKYLNEYLELIRDFIWTPAQVYYEYYLKKEGKHSSNGRMRKLNEIIKNITIMEKYCSEINKKIDNELKSYHRIDMGISKIMQDEFDKHIKEINFKMNFWKKELYQNKNRLSLYKYENNDVFLKMYNEILFSNIGEAYSEDEMMTIKEEAKKKYMQNLAPGSEDADKENNQYGDFIIWKQMIDKSRTSKKNIVFISNDNKRDWKDDNGKCKSELIHEFYELTGKKFIIMNIDEFVKYTTVCKSLIDLFNRFRFLYHDDIKNISPYNTRYNHYDLLEEVINQRKNELNLFSGENDCSFKELSKVRLIVDNYFTKLICGGIGSFRYAYSLDVFTNKENMNRLLCKILYKADEGLYITIAGSNDWYKVTEKAYRYDENNNIIKSGYIHEIILGIYQCAYYESYDLGDDEYLEDILRKIDEMQF